MRNMKRALSLVLAMVMLLGMVMVPTSAASNFKDADLIENTEAVQITSGIGLFAGTSDGNFAPKATVTRAQMATIIVKMLRGNDFNADSFKGVGVNPFPDTAAFEGGWAEGYINACYQMGVVAGYGDGTFKPGRELTTGEALTMIINALGIDPGTGDWPTNYLAKAEELKFYGDLTSKPGANEPLNRDQLAVIVWEGMQYSPKGQSGWRISGYDMVFENYADALKANGGSASGISEAVGEDTLASKVYEIKTATGFITGNQTTGLKYTELNGGAGSSDVEKYGIETGLDMIGHYVTVYYKELYTSDKQPGQVYTIVDESTVVTVSEKIETSKDYKAAFGSRCDMAGTNGNGVMLFDDTYDCDANDDGTPEFGAISHDGVTYIAGTTAPAGTYIIVDGAIVAYIEPATVYASYVVDINNTADNETIWLNGANGDDPIHNDEDDDKIVEYDGIKIDDYVTYVMVNDIYVLSPVEKVTGIVTKTTPAKESDDYDTITLNGTDYPAFETKGTSVSKNYATKLKTALSNVEHGQSYALYITEDGHYIGFEATGSALVLGNTVFLLGNVRIKETDQYGKTAFYNKGRGIDMEGNEVMITLGKAIDINGDKAYTEGEDPNALGSMSSVLQGYYSVSDSTDKDEKKEGIQVLNVYPGGYSPDTPTYTLKPYSTTTVFTGSGSLATEEGIAAYGKTGMKFFVVGGGVTDNSPLTVTASIPSGFKTTTEVSQNCYMLVTRTADGSQSYIDVFVYLSDVEVTKDVYFYVTQEQLDAKGQTVDGDVYTVYTATDAEETEILVDPDVDMTQVSAGMLKGQQNGDGVIVKVDPVVATSSLPSWTNEKTLLLANLGYIGVTNGRLRAANQGMDFFTAGNSNNTVTSAGVVDLRSEGEITASGVPQITSLNQLATLRENDPGLLVVLSLYAEASSSNWTVKTIFIEKAVRRTVGFNGIVYVTDFDVNSDGEKYANAVVASSSNYKQGDSVKVYADVITEKTPGFYIYTVDASGKIVLEPYFAKGTVYAGYSGMIAEDEKITDLTQIDKDTLQLLASNAHSDCGVGCNNQYEALKVVYVTSSGTRILDATAGMKQISLSEFYQMYRTNNLELEYFCDSGVRTGTKAADTSAELVVITSKSQIPCSCDGDHTGMTAVTGSSITGPGSYYLTADLKDTLTISGDVVTLCMNGHSIQPEVSGKDAVKSAISFSGTDLSLISCNGRTVSQLVGVNAAPVSVSGGTYTIDDNGLVSEQQMAWCDREGHGWHEGWNPLTGTLTSGQYYLAGNTTASGKITVTGNVTLCLGKNILTAPAGDVTDFITVNSGATLTIVADEGGTIKGSASTGTRGINVASGGTLKLESGTISGFTISQHGAGVYSSGTFTMNGGTIKGNKNGNLMGGGGVYVAAGNFTMNGGTITENGTIESTDASKSYTNARGGGVYFMSTGTFTMTGGTISKNYAYDGGGVLLQGAGSKFIMSGGSITENVRMLPAKETSNGGGGLALFSTSSAEITGGYITNNVCQRDGAGGGGIQAGANTNVTISGTVVISGNTRQNNATSTVSQGIYMLKGTGVKTISGGLIADSWGGAAGAVTVTGGEYTVSAYNSIKSYLADGYKETTEGVTAGYDYKVVKE